MPTTATTTDLHPARRARPAGRGPAPTAPHARTDVARRTTLGRRSAAEGDRPATHRIAGAGVDAPTRMSEVGTALTALPVDGVAPQGPPEVGVARTGRARTVARVVRGRVLTGSDAGMATAEYAIATVAAVGFAGLLMVVLRSGDVQALLLGLIRGALSV